MEARMNREVHVPFCERLGSERYCREDTKTGEDYLFVVKGNQSRLNKAFEEKFPLKELNNPENDSYAISEKSHGREEIRLHIV